MSGGSMCTVVSFRHRRSLLFPQGQQSFLFQPAHLYLGEGKQLSRSGLRKLLKVTQIQQPLL